MLFLLLVVSITLPGGSDASVNAGLESGCFAFAEPGLDAVFSWPVGVLALDGLDSGDLEAAPGKDDVRGCGCMVTAPDGAGKLLPSLVLPVLAL